MAFSYDKLWKTLIDKKMTKENFRILIKASPTTIAAMGKGDGISPKVLDRICTAFNCQPGDIMEHIPNANSVETKPFSGYAEPTKPFSEYAKTVEPFSEHAKSVKSFSEMNGPAENQKQI